MNNPSGRDPVLTGLLAEWEVRNAAGTPVTPEELCRDDPERVEEFRRQVGQLARVDPPPEPTEESAAATVPGFELRDEIGRGGMGVVYEARDLSLDRVVALKIPFRSRANLILRKRFEREVRALAKLRHPNIVSVYSAGLTGDTPYLVMEHVTGGNLATRMREAKTPPAAAAALLAKVARAVDAAHSAGIIHRDLKPANILLDRRGEPLVSDFGVAALLSGEALIGPSDDTPTEPPPAGHTLFTRTGGVVGTPAYSAPEQYDPESFGAVGPGTDVWSLGVILYELLTGRRPFAGRTPDELRDQVCRGEPIPAPEIGRRLRRVVDRCLTADPARRLPTAADLADALDATRPRRRWVPAAVAAAAIALGSGYALFSGSDRAVPAWPNLPAVHDARDRLARGEAVDLITPGRPPAAFDWATGPGSGRVIARDGDDFRVVNLSPSGCLVELLPDLPPGRFQIDAQLLHETGNGMSWVGLYAAASHGEIARGRQHCLLTARFTDHGSAAQMNPRNNAVQSNRRTHFLAQYFGDSDTDPMAGMTFPDFRPGGQLVEAPPAGLRNLSLTVDAEEFTARQADVLIGDMSRGEIMKSFSKVHREFPDLPEEVWSLRPFGGIGLYVHNGSLAVRSFRVTPRPIQ